MDTKKVSKIISIIFLIILFGGLLFGLIQGVEVYKQTKETTQQQEVQETNTEIVDENEPSEQENTQKSDSDQSNQ